MHNTIVRAIEQWHATSLKISCSLHALLKNIHISESDIEKLHTHYSY